ncbi:MAG TPA: FtsX-like permease family protein [Flavihumibacter sp.]|nr:FtsX-like permease family protein [Bacteroidota bacterium]HOA38921.1 FtsX-like permease family protein [Flavihumibacter sp.]HPZ89317.1 FtsX-like permease family protein [Flavihumibacter sp.]HQD10149.1 FtsX-like permease family protein [Flavihumibacter sp.]
MNLPRFIATRIAFNRQKSFSRFIIRLAIAATTISVAAMILALSFTAGFQYTIANKIFQFWGHIRVQHFEPDRLNVSGETPINRSDSVENLAHQIKGIDKIQAFATKNAILKTSESIEGILFKGYDKNFDTSRLTPFLKAGRWMNFPDSGYSNDIVVSAYTANQLSLKAGDDLLIYFIQDDGSAPRVRKLKVSGIYKTGIEEFDKLIAIGDIRLVQRLNDWPANYIGGYEVFLHDYKQIDSLNEKIFTDLPMMWNSRSIKEINPNIFDWLGLQDRTIIITIIILIIVAVLNLVTCLIILVLERTRMVGVLKALGAYNKDIRKIFLYHGAVITLAGIVLGNLLAFILIAIQKKWGVLKLPEDMYYIDKAEVQIIPWHILAVNIGTFIICLLVLLIPSLIIKKVQPVKAISFS